MEATANTSLRAAAIDLGSNSFRIMIADTLRGVPTVLAKRLETVGLGRGLSGTGKLPSGTIEKALLVLSSFNSDIGRLKPHTCRCCGTHALRQAGNAKLFLARAEHLLGMKIEILDGHAEAVLTCRGILAGLDKQLSAPFLFIDVGGGSTEITYLENNSSVPRTASIPLGALSLSEVSRSSRKISLLAEMAGTLSAFLQEEHVDPCITNVISSGGTATTLAALDLGLTEYDADKVQGHRLARSRIEEISFRISALTIEERGLLPCLDPGRGKIVLGGIEIFQEIIATIEVEGMIISDYGLLEGILFSSLEQQALFRYDPGMPNPV